MKPESVLVLSIVEGLTEFLPVSSTAHLLITTHILGIAGSEFIKHFIIFIQFGAILGVLVLYRKTFMTHAGLNLKILASFLPTAIVGFLFYTIITTVFFDNLHIMLAALFLGGILLIYFDLVFLKQHTPTASLETLSYKQAFAIGMFQAIAIIPGVSRSAATIIGSTLLGMDRKSAVEYSFLLAIPTIAVASIYDLTQSTITFTASHTILLLGGFSLSFVTAILAVRWFLSLLSRQAFLWFGLYRIILSVILFWLFTFS